MNLIKPSLALNPAVIADAEKHLSKCDKKLAKLIREVGPCTIELSDRPKFEMLVSAIISQQLSGKAATTIFNRLIDCAGNRKDLAKQLHSLGYDEIRACGTSSAKAKSILHLAEIVTTRQIDLEKLHEMNDEGVYRLLTAIPGIGPWTVQMFLMFALRRADIFSVGDAGLRRGLIKLYKMQDKPTENEMLAITNKWQPYRTIGSWYLWQVAD